jgi:hypothetical protein
MQSYKGIRNENEYGQNSDHDDFKERQNNS